MADPAELGMAGRAAPTSRILTKREKWCEELNTVLKGTKAISWHPANFGGHLTVINADEYQFDFERDLLIVNHSWDFLRAVWYHNQPPAYAEMEGMFVKPLCVKLVKGIWFRKYNLYIVPTGDKYLIYKERI